MHFLLALTGASRSRRRGYLVPAYLLAGLTWIASWAPNAPVHAYWNLIAIVVLGGILLAGILILAGHALSRPAGAERRALLYVLGGAVIAVVGGMSDLVPRSYLGVAQLVRSPYCCSC